MQSDDASLAIGTRIANEFDMEPEESMFQKTRYPNTHRNQTNHIIYPTILGRHASRCAGREL
jgi:hypothetical protein